MRFACLHGAVSNPEYLKVQLGPFVKELESDGSASFFFVQGKVAAHAPAGMQEYFGPGPHWRFIDDQGTAEKAMLERIRQFPDALTAEDTLRKLVPSRKSDNDHIAPIRPGLDYVFEQIEKEGDIEGVIGYSEGSMLAATMLFDEDRRLQTSERPRRLKMGIFFNGWPAMDPDGDGVLLSDETDEMIHVPTVHIVGSGDPYLQGALALYNLCDEDTAVLFDHGKGHTIPRDALTLKELGDTVRQAIKKAGE